MGFWKLNLSRVKLSICVRSTGLFLVMATWQFLIIYIDVYLYILSKGIKLYLHRNGNDALNAKNECSVTHCSRTNNSSKGWCHMPGIVKGRKHYKEKLSPKQNCSIFIL